MSGKAVILILLGLASSQALADNNYPTPIKEGVPGQRHGDIIAPISDEQIAAWCDFSRQVVVTKTKTLCAYVGGKIAVTPNTASASNVRVTVEKLATKKPSRPEPKDLTPTLYEMSEYENA